jgi:UDP-N-acetylglucosamine diphosphorylase/glucosamine-1-phosphate N-acetyltransferase
LKIVLFEDSFYKEMFPLSLLRGTFDIRTGVFSNLEHYIQDKNRYKLSLHCRRAIEPLLAEANKGIPVNEDLQEDCIFINGRVRISEKKLEELASADYKDCYIAKDDTVLAANVSADKINFLKSADERNVLSVRDFEEAGLSRKEYFPQEHDTNVYIFRYSWDVIKHLEETAEEDIHRIISSGGKEGRKSSKGVELINKGNIYIEKSASVMQNVVLDASHGGIVIEQNAVIEPFTYIKGPAYIGKNSLVKSGAKIYGPCVIGDYCKAAGEIAESVFHSYVNKQHEGFVGHSYICPFVNLGADTVTSDLKNNYSKLRMEIEGSTVDTGMQFIGSIIGDHSKTGINTMLNTGTIAGIFTNIFGGGFPPKKMVSFTWNEAGKEAVIYDINKALETAKIVMARRGIDLTSVYEQVVREYFRNISVDRDYPSI